MSPRSSARSCEAIAWKFVFDALTSDRVYRPAFPVGIALDMMAAERGCHFDPEPLDAMLAVFPQIEAVRRIYGD